MRVWFGTEYGYHTREKFTFVVISTNLIGSSTRPGFFAGFTSSLMDHYHRCRYHTMMMMIRLVLTSNSTRRRNIYRPLWKLFPVNVPCDAHFGDQAEFRQNVFGRNGWILPGISPTSCCHEQRCWTAQDLAVGYYYVIGDVDVAAQGTGASTIQWRHFVVVRRMVVAVVVLVVDYDRMKCFWMPFSHQYTCTDLSWWYFNFALVDFVWNVFECSL